MRQQISITIPSKFEHKIKADKYLKTHITNNYFRGLVAESVVTTSPAILPPQ